MKGDPILGILEVAMSNLNRREIGPMVTIEIGDGKLRSSLRGRKGSGLRGSGGCAAAGCDAQDDAQVCQRQTCDSGPRAVQLSRCLHEPGLYSSKRIRRAFHPAGSQGFSPNIARIPFTSGTDNLPLNLCAPSYADCRNSPLPIEMGSLQWE